MSIFGEKTAGKTVASQPLFRAALLASSDALPHELWTLVVRSTPLAQLRRIVTYLSVFIVHFFRRRIFLLVIKMQSPFAIHNLSVAVAESPFSTRSSDSDSSSPRSEKLVNVCRNCSFSYRLSRRNTAEYCSKGEQRYPYPKIPSFYF